MKKVMMMIFFKPKEKESLIGNSKCRLGRKLMEERKILMVLWNQRGKSFQLLRNT
jgi:hypothetical protein